MTQTTTILPLPDDIASSRKLRPLVEQASEWVAEMAGGWPTPLTGEWYRISNTGRDEMVGIRFTDKYATAHGVFRTADLSHAEAFREHLNPVLLALTNTSLDRLRDQSDRLVSSGVE